MPSLVRPQIASNGDWRRARVVRWLGLAAIAAVLALLCAGDGAVSCG